MTATEPRVGAVQAKSGPASPIGMRVRNLDWEAKTGGLADYVGDLQLPNMLHARLVRSVHAHANIRGVDTTAAEAVDGVIAIVTAADFDNARYTHHGGPLADRTVLAGTKVRYVGEEIAGVAAETAVAANQAAGLVTVDYELLEGAFDFDSARHPKASQIHEDKSGNVAMHIERHWGESGTGTKSVAASGVYTFARQTHACMEPNSVVANWNGDTGHLDVWISTQSPYLVRKELAGVLSLAPEQIDIHEIAVGGGFGSKSKISEFEAVACKLSMKSGRPVRLVLTREEEFGTTKARHNAQIELATEATTEGRILSRQAKVAIENGAYNHSGPSVMGYGTLVLGSFYRTYRVDIEADLIYTNKHPGGQFRGYGSPQVTFAIESQMDELAEALNIDPIEIRIRNANQAGDVSHTGWKIDSARLVECLEAARDAIDWDNKRKLKGSGRGVGLAAAIHVSGAFIYEDANRSASTIDVTADGTIIVRFGGADAGTWQKTLLAQFAATELNVAPEEVSVITMDTATTPRDLGAWSSRGTYMSGHAVAASGKAMRDRLLSLAADALGEHTSDLRLADHRVIGATGSRSFAELATQGGVDGVLTITKEVELDIEPLDPMTGLANFSGAYSFAVQAVEVDVDSDTGKVTVLDAISVHDSGVVVNPIGFESQVIGGMAMGLGAALGEELLYEQGRPINPSYLNYPLPRAADLPPIRPLSVQGEDPHGPYGAKAVGEIVLIPTAAAVANAVAHATGVRIRELPLTPDRVLGALRQDQAQSRSYGLVGRPSRWWIAGIRSLYPRGLQKVLHRYGTLFGRVHDAQPIEQILSPTSIEDASVALKGGAAPLAGGTDLLPARNQGLVEATTLVDLCTIPGLATVAVNDGALRIGASVRLTKLESGLNAEMFGGAVPAEARLIAMAATRIASPQVRSMATVAGNLCQQKRCWFYRNDFNCFKRGGTTCPCYAVDGDHRFYHAAVGAHRCQAVTPSDLATAFSTLDAMVIIARSTGQRQSVSMSSFYTGPGETALADGDIITAIEVQLPSLETTDGLHSLAGYQKLNLWEGDFAVVSAAVALRLDESKVIRHAAISVGALAPEPLRLASIEKALVGHRPDRVKLRSNLDALWSKIGHPLRNNEWKLDAATGVVLHAFDDAIASE